jgi:hypothetical protein
VLVSIHAYFCLVLLLLDNYDSFTYNLYDYFLRCGAEVEVIRNNEIELDNLNQKYEGIILSPGPGKPKDAGKMMQLIEQYHDKLPILVSVWECKLSESFLVQISYKQTTPCTEKWTY